MSDPKFTPGEYYPEDLIDAADVASNDKTHDYNKGAFPCKITSRQQSNRIAASPDLFDALKTFWAFYNDLAASNPGFMGKLTLQDYSQWNQALLKTERALAKAEGQ